MGVLLLLKITVDDAWRKQKCLKEDRKVSVPGMLLVEIHESGRKEEE